MKWTSTMKNMIRAASVLLILFTLALPSTAEIVFKKDGSIVRGTIVTDTNTFVTVKTVTGKRVKVERKKILRVIFTKLDLTKMLVKLRDGREMEVFLVAEGNTTYTFRRELTSPEEFTILRKKVLFMADKKPTELKGTPDTTSIRITWLPPYNRVKKYNIYIQRDDQKTWELFDDTGSKDFLLKNLKSNSSYRIKVRAVDRDGYESLPTNILTIRTLNKTPQLPDHARLKREKDSEGKIIKATLTWEPAADADGTIRTYRVYKKDKGKLNKVAEVKDTSITLENFNPREKNIYVIRAIDNDGGASEDIYFYGYNQKILYTLNTSFLLPFQGQSNLSAYGIGLDFNCWFTNLFIEGFDAGGRTGIDYFFPKTEYLKAHLIFPLIVQIRYRFTYKNIFDVAPSLGAGMVFSILSYDYLDISGPATLKSTTEAGVNGAVSAGLNFTFYIDKNLSLFFGAEYTLMVARDGLADFLSIPIGVGYRLDL